MQFKLSLLVILTSANKTPRSGAHVCLVKDDIEYMNIFIKVILEAAVCGAVILYFVLYRGVFLIL